MPPRRPLQLLCALLIALIATLAVAPRSARGADSFYTDLLSRGSQAYSSGDYRDAERMFRIACFGFLDEPPLLLEGLVRLSLARAAAGDVEGFREAFGRISDLERRFGTYSATTLPDSLRQLFEQELLARIPSRDLEALELRTGASRSIGADMEGLPLRQRRAELMMCSPTWCSADLIRVTNCLSWPPSTWLVTAGRSSASWGKLALSVWPPFGVVCRSCLSFMARCSPRRSGRQQRLPGLYRVVCPPPEPYPAARRRCRRRFSPAHGPSRPP